jgi:hypothetical protein
LERRVLCAGDPAAAALGAAGELNFDAASYEVHENAGALTLTVTRSGGSAGAVSVNWYTFDFTATGGQDYQPASGSVELLDGETSKPFRISIVDDAEYEVHETFRVELLGPGGGATLGVQATAQAAILNDDPLGPPPVAEDDAFIRAPGQDVVDIPVLANDSPWAEGLLFTVEEDPVGGVVSVNPVPHGQPPIITYTANPGFLGSDTFVYRLMDNRDRGGMATVTIDVQGAGLVADPGDPESFTLRVVADDNDNTVRLDRGRRGAIRVTVDGVEPTGSPFRGADRVVVVAGGGNDVVLGGRMKVPLVFYGGAGDDTAVGGYRPDVLVGGDGDDNLTGGWERDLLIGGTGADALRGISNCDILVAGTTAYDTGTPANRRALTDLSAAWAGRGRLAARLAKIQSDAGVGASGARLAAQTVLDDAAPDRLWGGGGTDALFARTTETAPDVLGDRRRPESLFEL